MVRFVKEYKFLHHGSVKLVKADRYLGPNTYSFWVPLNFGKPTIQTYFEQLYGVEIININTVVHDRKRIRLPGNNIFKIKRGQKKAFITFSEPFEPKWDTYDKAPSILWHLQQQFLRKRGKGAPSGVDPSKELAKAGGDGKK
mmetsp:Transcript_102935/g.125825  ORF Transcript_102935/g.125825 Transcript_102935/m.125825 type:complete len:142 (-) Transcript_102935:239-664(-)